MTGKTPGLDRSNFAALLFVIGSLLVVGAVLPSAYANSAAQSSPTQLIVASGPTTLPPGSTTLWHIQVWRSEDGKPVKRADVKLVLEPSATVLYEGKTDAGGQVQATFQVPDLAEGVYALIIEVRSSLGRERLDQEVLVRRQARLLLTTDRPVYRPGQAIHIRALAANAFTREPLSAREVEATITNPQGIKVFQRTATTSEAGIAAWDFPISPMVDGGQYEVTVALRDTVSTKTLRVEAKVPQFRVKPTFDRPFYLPGDRVSGYITASYLYGRPVRDATVELTGWAYDGTRNQVFARTSRTDESGYLHFDFPLPDAFAADRIGPMGADFVLEIAVTDPDGHTVRVSRRLPVGAQPIHIRAVPESGTLKPGVENIVYLLTTHPDTSPANCQVSVEIEDTSHDLTTGPLGASRFSLTPSGSAVRLVVTAQDQQGRISQEVISLPVEQLEQVLLLRPDRPLYSVGDTLQATILSPGLDGKVEVVLLRDGQLLDSQPATIENGMAAISFPLTPYTGGLLQLFAYKPLPDGQVLRDTRTVFVRPGEGLDLQVKLDRPTYRPGEEARATFEVRTEAGHPISATLGIAVVDKSAFHEQEPDPALIQWALVLGDKAVIPDRDPGHPFVPNLLEPVGLDLVEGRNAALSVGLADLADPQPLTIVTGGVGITPATGAISQEPSEGVAVRQDQHTSPSTIVRLLLAILLPLGAIGVLAFLWIRRRLKGRVLAVGLVILVGTILLGVLLFLLVPDREGPEPFSEDTPAAETATNPADTSLPSATPFPATLPVSITAPANPKRSHDPLLDPVFPETMAWYTATQTTDLGSLEIDLQLPEQITATWQLMALASTRDGRIAWASVLIPVYQELWAEVELPPVLKYGEQVAVPVEVYNYYGDEQPVRVTLPPEPWFRHVVSPTQEIELPPAEMETVCFPIEVTTGGGRAQLEVEVTGEGMSDSFSPRTPSEIVFDGQCFDEALSDRLPGTITVPVSIPPDAIPNASQIDIKIYPGTLSHVVEGIDSLLGRPYGCFEQASSVSYPTIMVLQLQKALGQAHLSTTIKADFYLSLGYQFIVSFEVPGGGFSLWGDPPADRMLSAYGLMELVDMAEVRPVDRDLIQRTAGWLLDQQNPDGTWDNDQGLVHETSWSRLEDSHLPVTAYVTWALIRAGYAEDSRTQAGLDYVQTYLDRAKDPYVLALCANALVAADPRDAATQTAVDRLAQAAVVRNRVAFWPSGIATFVGSSGLNGSIETTALATQALLRAEQHSALAYQALTYLIRQKGLAGAWGTTQGTVLSLQALQLAALRGTDLINATVRVSANGYAAEPIQFTPEESDVAPTVSFTHVVTAGTNLILIEVEGSGNLAYQIHTTYCLPWPTEPPSAPERTNPLTLDMQYEPARLRVGDRTRVKVHVELREGTIEWGIAELAVPPGFEVEAEDMERLLAAHQDPPPNYSGAKIIRIDRNQDRIIVYFERLEAGQPLDFHYYLYARSPVKLATPPSRAYDYYNPDISAETRPSEIESIR